MSNDPNSPDRFKIDPNAAPAKNDSNPGTLEQVPFGSNVEVGRGNYTVRSIAGQDGIEQSGPVSAETYRATNAANGILATARRSWGSPASTLDDSCVVDVGGIETSIANAVQQGVLRRVPGGYEETGANLAQNIAQDQATQQAAHEAPPIEPLNAGAQAAHEFLSAALPDDTMRAVIEQAIAGGGVGAVDRSLYEASGLNVEQFTKAAGALLAGHQQNADNAIRSKTGQDPNDVYEWAKTNRPQELQRAMREQYATQSPHLFVTLADKYMRNVTPDAQTLRQSGHHVNAATRGRPETVVLIDKATGQEIEMETRIAARLGLI